VTPPELESIIYISLPEDTEKTIEDFQLDPDILLPVEVAGGFDQWDPQDLRWEQIISAMLKILAYDEEHEHADYYRSFILAARPDLVDELSETAIMKARNQDFEIAEEIFRALKGLLPQDPRPRLNLALLYEERGAQAKSIEDEEQADRYVDRAFETYRELLNQDDVLPESYLNAGYFFLKQQSFSDARSNLTAYMASSDDAEKIAEVKKVVDRIDSQNLADQLFKEAYDFIQLGQEEEGIKRARAFLAEHPKVWNGWFLLGWGYRRLGRYEDARDAFVQALELAPKEVDCLNELAICNMELENFSDAAEALRKALEIEPENVKVISNLGVLALKTGRQEEAMGYFRTVLEFEPADPVAKRYLDLLSE
jgi:Flp pilus assembly protein TadD